ncbi:hypothetical protein [Cohnella luojiensis]|uniref:Uncharacterized protein n=1 Tax=Cohnella luojiensis TaxID=652876 RepID=A0A4Y8M014_9BACL|nr:hypothetical protein [Cohnella luojiensis]TFE28134.1 hypothetical protein E2980_07910 [Cohnella luojiensis]
MKQAEKTPFGIKSGKLAALTLLLTVPVMMTGCNQVSSSEECNPNYDECEYDDDHGVYVYSSKSKKYKASSGYKSNSSSKSYSGFGSGGKSSTGG